MSLNNKFARVSIEYIVCEDAGGDAWEVQKLENGERIIETYAVGPDRKFERACTCMAFISGKTRPCKHMRLVTRWIGEGRPIRTYQQKEVTS